MGKKGPENGRGRRAVPRRLFHLDFRQRQELAGIIAAHHFDAHGGGFQAFPEFFVAPGNHVNLDPSLGCLTQPPRGENPGEANLASKPDSRAANKSALRLASTSQAPCLQAIVAQIP